MTKEKMSNALHILHAITSENFDFILIWGVAMGIIFKLAWG